MQFGGAGDGKVLVDRGITSDVCPSSKHAKAEGGNRVVPRKSALQRGMVLCLSAHPFERRQRRRSG